MRRKRRRARVDLGDPELFGNEAAEEEKPEVLASYFVEQPGFATFLKQDRRLQFARARKGMGKSALLAKLGFDLRGDPEHLVISVTGADLTGLGEFASADPAVLVNQWQQVICARITQEIGRKIGIAVTDTEMLMVEHAELAGLKDRNLLRALVDRLGGKVGKLTVTRPDFPDPAAALRRYAADHDRAVWLLVDDIDATFSNTEAMKLKIGTFFSAARKMAREVAGLSIRASVRSDVWVALRGNEDLDKAEQYMTSISWTNKELEVLLAKRIASYLDRRGIAASKSRSWDDEEGRQRTFSHVFARRLRWGDQEVHPVTAVRILSMRRPRWMAQLCRLAATEAARVGANRIGGQQIQTVMPRFGELRLADLYKEYQFQFSELRQLIECFAGGRRTYTTEELEECIKSRYLTAALQRGVPILAGKPIGSARSIGHFLFRTGFLQGQHQEERPDKFFAYENRPDLLITDANLDDGAKWAVHPAYRKVLQIR